MIKNLCPINSHELYGIKSVRIKKFSHAKKEMDKTYRDKTWSPENRFWESNQWLETRRYSREHELLHEAHAWLFVILNCSRFSLPAYSLFLPPPVAADPPPPHNWKGVDGGKAAAGVGVSRECTQRENLSSLGRQKGKHGLLVIIHIFWCIVPLHVQH